MTTYNHAYDIAFSISGSKCKDGTDVTGAQLRKALLKKLAGLTDDGLMCTVCYPYDTYVEDE